MATAVTPRNAAAKVDPITVEVIGSAISALVEEMGETLVRSAYSTNIKERRDCSTALFDARGHTIAQAEHIPIHLGSLMGIVEHILQRCPVEQIRPGDVFIGNDAYTGGGTHLNDIVLAEPVFVDGVLAAWASNLAHHADFVDRGHAHIFQEGLRIPPVRLYREGVLQQDLLDLVLLNCQVPQERTNDFRAQMAANRLGVQRFQALCAKYGTPTMLAACAGLLDYSERRMRAGIRQIPDGVYRFEDRLDTDEFDEPLTLKVAIEVRGDEMHFDFAGNPPQVRGPINAVMTALLATLYYIVKAIVDPEIPPNSGLYRPIKVSAPAGSIVNAQPPAAVYSRTQVCQRIADMVLGALAPALPERALGASTGGGLMNFSGINPRTGRLYVYNESIAGGLGARWLRDGLDGAQAHITNTSNLPVEALEPEHPLIVERYELVRDSGGAGRTRGGMAIRRQIRVVGHDARVIVWGACITTPPWGLFGGQPGGTSRTERSAGVAALAKGRGVVPAGESVALVTAGAGGYGEARARDRVLVRRDLAEDRISAQQAHDAYGLDPQPE